MKYYVLILKAMQLYKAKKNYFYSIINIKHKFIQILIN